MASVPGNEIPEIKPKVLNANYPPRFINSVIRKFNQKSSEMDDFIISPSLFEIPKKVVLVEIPYCPKMKLFLCDLSKSLMSLQITNVIYL